MIKFISKPASLLHRQQGAALILLFLAILMTGTVVFVTSISMNRSRIQSDAQTMQSLAKAKEALIAFAATFYERNNAGLYGFLPCPETAGVGTEGNAAGTCSGRSRNTIGRFPWRSLNLTPLKDSAGECLWYAATGEFKFGNYNPGSPPPPSTRSEMLNDDSVGMFRLLDESGTTIQGNIPENRVVAVIIAPGKSLPGQTRPDITQNTPPVATDCTIQPSVANPAIAQYLENFNGVNNSDVNAATTDAPPEDFISATNNENPNLNDRIITITAAEIFNAIQAQTNFQTRMRMLTRALAQCLANYGANNASTTNHRLPWPARVDLNGADYRFDNSYIETANINFGRYPLDIAVSDGNTNNDDGSGSDPTTLLDKAYCNAFTLNLDSNGDGTADVNLQGATSEYRLLWKHWKDHFFYALSKDFEPTSTADTPATCGVNCISSNSSMGNRFAGMVIFSGQRLPAQNQRRLSSPPEQAAPPPADSKDDLSNYLEGNNATNIHNGTDEYMTGTINDVAFCIPEAMGTVVQCP